MNRKQITQGLEDIGACWAVTNEKTQLPGEHKRFYHIHGDASYPHVDAMWRFSTLQQIADYIYTAKRVLAETQGLNPMEASDYAEDLWGAFWNTIN